MHQVKEKDWKLFRKKLPVWQEVYMERLIKDYAELLDGDEAASEKFWALDKRIRADRKRLGVCVDEVSRSKLQNILTGLIIENVISYYSLIKRFNNPISRSNTCNRFRRYGLDNGA